MELTRTTWSKSRLTNCPLERDLTRRSRPIASALHSRCLPESTRSCFRMGFSTTLELMHASKVSSRRGGQDHSFALGRGNDSFLIYRLTLCSRGHGLGFRDESGLPVWSWIGSEQRR